MEELERRGDVPVFIDVGRVSVIHRVYKLRHGRVLLLRREELVDFEAVVVSIEDVGEGRKGVVTHVLRERKLETKSIPAQIGGRWTYRTEVSKLSAVLDARTEDPHSRVGNTIDTPLHHSLADVAHDSDRVALVHRVEES